MTRLWLLLACLAVSSLATWQVSAQVIVDPSLRNPDKREGRPAVQPNFTAKAQAPWPRLDSGAVLCRTRDDLDQHHRAIEARLGGAQIAPQGTANCRMVGLPTAIDIVSRASPSATEVRVRGEASTAWTDTWIPAQPPH